MATRFNEHADARDLLPPVGLSCSPLHGDGRYWRTQSSGTKRWNCGVHVSALVFLDLSEQCLLHRRSRDLTWFAGKTFRHSWNGSQMVLLIPQRSNAAIPSGIAELKSVCHLLQCVSWFRPRSSALRGVYRGFTSGDRTIRHRTSSLRWWYSALGWPTYHIRCSLLNMTHCIDAVHTLYSSKRLRLNPTKSEIIWLGTRACLKRLQHTDLSLHVGTVAIKLTSDLVCCSSVNWRCGNKSANSRDYVIIISDDWRRFDVFWAPLSHADWCLLSPRVD